MTIADYIQQTGSTATTPMRDAGLHTSVSTPVTVTPAAFAAGAAVSAALVGAFAGGFAVATCFG